MPDHPPIQSPLTQYMSSVNETFRESNPIAGVSTAQKLYTDTPSSGVSALLSPRTNCIAAAIESMNIETDTDTSHTSNQVATTDFSKLGIKQRQTDGSRLQHVLESR